MGKINSREKGKAGERDFAKFLRAHGVEARRGQQFSGGDDSPDVVHAIDGVHFEVKRTERLELHAALKQAIIDAPEGAMPVVAHRRNRGDWIAIVPMTWLIKLLLRR